MKLYVPLTCSTEPLLHKTAAGDGISVAYAKVQILIYIQLPAALYITLAHRLSM